VTADLTGSATSSPGPYGDVESLFRAAYNDLVRFAYALLGNHADTEDAAQNSFYKLTVAWTRVGGLPTARAQRAYLMRTVINEALQMLRHPHRKWERLGLDPGEQGSIQESFEENVPAREDLRRVWQAISDLPAARREVVALRAAGYEYEEIAATLGITISAVRSHISYARQRLSQTAPRDWEGAQE
jgi:RNA polymerase sigma-70 factor (ECF subfamily)